MMKTYLFAVVLLISMAQSAYAQSLDIGGIELPIGQKADEALRFRLVARVPSRHANGTYTRQNFSGDTDHADLMRLPHLELLQQGQNGPA